MSKGSFTPAEYTQRIALLSKIAYVSGIAENCSADIHCKLQDLYSFIVSAKYHLQIQMATELLEDIKQLASEAYPEELDTKIILENYFILHEDKVMEFFWE